MCYTYILCPHPKRMFKKDKRSCNPHTNVATSWVLLTSSPSLSPLSSAACRHRRCIRQLPASVVTLPPLPSAAAWMPLFCELHLHFFRRCLCHWFAAAFNSPANIRCYCGRHCHTGCRMFAVLLRAHCTSVKANVSTVVYW